MPDTERSPRGEALAQALDWLLDKVSGAEQRTVDAAADPACEGKIDRWIAVACTSAGTAGFLTNMGGVLTLPVALPANIVGIAAIQLRLIADIAICRGYDIRSQEVRTLAIACLAGQSALDILKEFGIQLGRRASEQAMNRIAAATLKAINTTVIGRLLAKAGAQGVVNLTKFVPLVGGVIGAGVDAASTKAVGEVAKRVFVARSEPLAIAAA